MKGRALASVLAALALVLSQAALPSFIPAAHMSAAAASGPTLSAQFATIAAAVTSSAAVRSGGTVWTWGDNSAGQLGTGTAGGNKSSPVQVVGPSGIGNLSGIVAIATNDDGSHFLALKSDGTVWAWGADYFGQLGNGTTVTAGCACIPSPVQVSGISGVIQLAVGADQSLALKNDGTVWSWGGNGYGDLGIGRASTTPAQIPTLSGVVAIGAGGFHSVALRGDGTMWAWGDDESGQLCDGRNGIGTTSSSPVQMAGFSGVTSIAVGGEANLALKADGSLWACGSQVHGQFGNGSTSPSYAATPGPTLASVQVLGSADQHFFAVLGDGTLWDWGRDFNGELGNGTTVTTGCWCVANPVKVQLSAAAAAVGGEFHSVGLDANGGVWAWGSNVFGQLGNGTASDSSVPVAVQFPVAPPQSSSATITNVNSTGDPYFNNTFTPGQPQQLSVAITGSLTSAYLYVDGAQGQSVVSGGTITWTPPSNPDGTPLFAAHTLVVQGTDTAGNPVSSQPLVLYALVEVRGDAASILPGGGVPYNPFSTDPFTAYCLNFLPPTGCTGQPPPSPGLFRMLNEVIIDGKSNGSSFIEAPRVTRDATPGNSFYCDQLASKGAQRTNTLSGPFADADPLASSPFTSYISTLESRVNVTLPNVFRVLVPAGTTGPTNQSDFVPWIYSSLYAGISPAGHTIVRWADQTNHPNYGNSLFPYHYLYKDGALQSPLPHPTPDLVAWTRTAAASPAQLLNVLYTGMSAPVAWVLQQLLKNIAPDIYAAQHLFAAERAECARERFAELYQNATPNLESYLQAHFPGLPIWYPFALTLNQNVQPHFNGHEFAQGVAQAGFVRDSACVVPGCPGLEHMKVVGVFSPVSVDVYDSAGHHSGPLPDGTIEQGIDSVTYLTVGHGTFLIIPNDPSYRVQLTGTGTGTFTLNATDFNGQAKLEFEQYDNVPVTPSSTGSLVMGTIGTPISWDVAGTGSPVQLTPTTVTTNPASDSADTTPPTTTATVQGVVGQPGYYRSPVDITFVGHDDLSGVARTEFSLDGGTTWTPYTTSPLHFGNDGSYQLMFRSLDYVGNQEQPQSINFVVDTTPPTIAMTSPSPTTYTLGQSVSASYSCADSGSGIATCAGTVPNGSSLDTSSVGQKSFTVVATDRAGNQTQVSVPYGVTYAVCALYDQNKTHVSGSTIPVKLSICDVNGNDASNAAITVTATGLTEISTSAPGTLDSSGNANPDNNFRFDSTLGTSGGYIYNLSTTGLTTGTYALSFSVAGDSQTHTVQFEIR